MRRPLALAALLTLLGLTALGCGYSSSEIVKRRDPSGGVDQGPDVHDRMVDNLRAVEVTVAGKRFEPPAPTVGLDSVVRIINTSKRPVELRVIRLLGHPLGNQTLRPGQRIEREYLRGGVEEFGVKGSRARLVIKVYPSS
jgi:hypothetical protein